MSFSQADRFEQHVNNQLSKCLGAIPNEELDAHPLDYRPANQPKDEPLRYHGVLRSATVQHNDQTVSIRVLVVKSRKVKLDRERRQTYLDRLTSRLEKIQSMLNTRRYKKRDYAWNQIEKARGGNPSKGLVKVELTGSDGNLKLTYQINQEKLAQAEAVDGRYLLGTNDDSLSALEMLVHFKGQEIVERRFKVVKGPIQIRPIFLPKSECVEGLILVAMIALLVYTILEMLCHRAGQPITARQVLEKFKRLGAIYLQFRDGSILKSPSALTTFQGQLIDLVKFPPPEVYLQPREAVR